MDKDGSKKNKHVKSSKGDALKSKVAAPQPAGKGVVADAALHARKAAPRKIDNPFSWGSPNPQTSHGSGTAPGTGTRTVFAQHAQVPTVAPAESKPVFSPFDVPGTASAPSTAVAPSVSAPHSIPPPPGPPPLSAVTSPQHVPAPPPQRKKRRTHRTSSCSGSGGDASSSGCTGSGDNSSPRSKRGSRRRRKEKRSHSRRRRRRKHSKGPVPPDAWTVWPPPPSMAQFPSPWGWAPTPHGFAWEPSTAPTPPAQTGAAWVQSPATGAVVGPSGSPATAPTTAAPGGSLVVPDGSPPAAASTPADVGDMAPVSAHNVPAAASQTTVSEAAAPAPVAEIKRTADLEVDWLPGPMASSSKPPLDLASGPNKADSEDGRDSSCTLDSESESRGEHLAAAADPYMLKLAPGEGPLSDCACEATNGASDEEAMLRPPLRLKLDPLVAEWQGPAMTVWCGPPLLLELDPNTARECLPVPKRSPADIEDGLEAEKVVIAGEPSDADVCVEGVGAGFSAPGTLQMPLWGRVGEWTTSPTPLDLEDSLRRVPADIKSTEALRREAIWSRAVVVNDDYSLSSADPLSPTGREASRNEPEAFQLSIASVSSQRSIRHIAWYPPPLVDLSPEILRDPAQYVGTERAGRETARDRVADPASALALEDRQNDMVVASLSSPGIATVDPFCTKALSHAAPPVLGPLSSPGPDPDVPCSGEHGVREQYTSKLIGLMQQLEREATPPDGAVREFWARLSTEDRVRFSSEFPQFMHYILGPAAQSISQSPGARVSQPAVLAAAGHPAPIRAPLPSPVAPLAQRPTRAAPAPPSLVLAASTQFVPRPKAHSAGLAGPVAVVLPKTLRVDGLLPSVTADQLARHFGQHGQLMGVDVKKRPGGTTSMVRHVGFVKFARAEDAERAQHALDGTAISGNVVRVAERTLPGPVGAQLGKACTPPGGQGGVGGVAAPLPCAPSSDSMAVVRQKHDTWAARLTFHNAVLRVAMRSTGLNDADMAEWCAWVPALLNPIVQHSNSRHANEDLDFADNSIGDHGFLQLVAVLRQCGVHCAHINVDDNRLTDQSLCILADLIDHFSLPILEVRMERNTVKSSHGITQLACRLQSHAAYPVWRESLQRYTPFMLWLGENLIEEPDFVTQLLFEPSGTRPCLTEEQRSWEVPTHGPPIQLPRLAQQRLSAFTAK